MANVYVNMPESIKNHEFKMILVLSLNLEISRTCPKNKNVNISGHEHEGFYSLSVYILYFIHINLISIYAHEMTNFSKLSIIWSLT